MLDRIRPLKLFTKSIADVPESRRIRAKYFSRSLKCRRILIFIIFLLNDQKYFIMCCGIKWAGTSKRHTVEFTLEGSIPMRGEFSSEKELSKKSTRPWGFNISITLPITNESEFVAILAFNSTKSIQRKKQESRKGSNEGASFHFHAGVLQWL